MSIELFLPLNSCWTLEKAIHFSGLVFSYLKWKITVPTSQIGRFNRSKDDNYMCSENIKLFKYLIKDSIYKTLIYLWRYMRDRITFLNPILSTHWKF